ncbi:hypothetical protein AJ80_00186 [Polytolypa hystricis UAMH7299]|uniref:Fungal-type protein kinase domain-containing protein n=1 Tax=Polytolypa hystricis (strain UAMH7299) TaxID=1447883 RepID=A0A2B7Z3X6_POLH7|nr:hypothetical protein AJ80_00186 [Polytolypa hystricis UAMH7299]
MAPSTIYESFHRSLDALPYSAVPNDYRTISPSALSTVQEDAPTAFIVESPAILINAARSKLSAHEGSTESACLSSKIAISSIRKPILLAAGNLLCRGEVTSNGGCRTDVRWVYRNGSQMTTIAILEVKNTKVLHAADFTPASATVNNARAKRDAAQGQLHHTHFARNACWLSKQAKKYYRNTTTPDVALFDWGAMFIFDFSGMNENALNPVLARGIWFSESDSGPSQGISFRMVLLGFIVRALRRRNLIS